MTGPGISVMTCDLELHQAVQCKWFQWFSSLSTELSGGETIFFFVVGYLKRELVGKDRFKYVVLSHKSSVHWSPEQQTKDELRCQHGL